MTTLDVTERESGTEADPRAHARGVPARRGGPLVGTDGAKAESASAITHRHWRVAAGALTRLAECEPYTARPASVAQVVAYTRAGGWVPGEHSWLWELPGYAYGWAVAVPLTAAGNAALWIGQRPTRVALVVLTLTLLWLWW